MIYRYALPLNILKFSLQTCGYPRAPAGKPAGSTRTRGM